MRARPFLLGVAVVALLFVGGVVGYSLRPLSPVVVDPVADEAALLHDALRRCADWGLVDLSEVPLPSRPHPKPRHEERQVALDDGRVATVRIERFPGPWHWAPGVLESMRGEQPPPAPAELDLLLDRSSMPFLVEAAGGDPGSRPKVAATGILVTIVSDRLPGWIRAGEHHEACWSLLRALAAPRAGGKGLLYLFETTVQGDRHLGVAMTHALVARMGDADLFTALCFGDAIWQSGLRLDEIGDRLAATAIAGAQPAAVACAYILARMRPTGEHRALAREVLRSWLALELGPDHRLDEALACVERS